MNYLDLFKPEDISIAKCWGVIASALFNGRQVSPVQHDEMRRTFYMGFSECFKIMSDLSERLTEEQASDVLTKLSQEVNRFHSQEIEELIGKKP